MEDIPRRLSIVNQTVAFLRSRITKGHWNDWLPGERQLTDQLQVSRNTVRSALDQLSREGLIRRHHGAGTEVVAAKQQRRPSMRSRDIALLMPEPLEQLQPRQNIFISELRGLMSERGCSLHIFHGQRYFRGNPGPMLKKLVKSEPHGCWILSMTNKAVQKWFLDNGVRCIVAGSAYPGIELPFSDLDHRSVCRHAVGVMLRSGHTRIAYVAFKSGRAGDLEGVEGFAEGVRLACRFGVESQVIYHDPNPASIRQAVIRLIEQKHPPTALLVANAFHFLAVATQLSQMGRRIPQDISVICRDDGSFLNFFIPEPTRYIASGHAMAKSIWRPILELLEGGVVTHRGGFIMPEFIQGATIAPPAPTRA